MHHGTPKCKIGIGAEKKSWIYNTWNFMNFIKDINLQNKVQKTEKNAVQLLSRIWFCDPMDCSTLGFPVLHNCLKLAQTHVQLVMPSYHLLYYPLLLPFSEKNKPKEIHTKTHYIRQRENVWKNVPQCIFNRIADFSSNMATRREWVIFFKIIKEKNCQPRILYLTKLSIGNEELRYFRLKRKAERVWF